MAKSPVKFYSVSHIPETPTDGAIYFVNGGELYKGASRFGANKVWTVPSDATITGETEAAKLSAALTAAGVTGAIGGDILTGYGAAKVFNGSTWVDLGADSSATDALAAKVSTLESDVSDIKTVVTVTTTPGEEPATTTTVNANSGSFTALLVGGSTIQELISAGADARIAAIPTSTVNGTSNGITVSVTTAGGSVTAVTVNAAAFANVVNFDGVITSGDLPPSPKKGDIVVIGTPNTEADPPEELAQELRPGQEYIYTGDTVGEGGATYDSTKWQLIGDQTTTQDQIDTAIASAMRYSSAAGVTSSASTLNSAVAALASAIDGAKTEISSPDSDSGDLVTASAVVGYVAGTRWNASDTAYPIGEGENRPSIAVEIDESAEKKVTVTATNFGTAVGANVVTLAQGETFASKSNSGDLPTASQVYSLVSEKIGAVTASTIAFDYKNNQENPTNITSSASTVQGAIAILDSTVASALSDISGLATTMSNLGEAAYKGVATSIGPTVGIPAEGTEGQGGYKPAVPAASDDKLATEKAVRDALEQATLCWYDDEDVNNEGSGTETP